MSKEFDAALVVFEHRSKSNQNAQFERQCQRFANLLVAVPCFPGSF
jgi:hypothetical protein